MMEDRVDEEGEETGEEEEGPPAPVFVNSSSFSFLTSEAYRRLEEEHPEVTSGKLFKHVRPMRARVGVLENPHGSVRLWQGSTSVLVAVYGPSDVKMSKELPHRAAVDVLYRPKVTGSANVSSMMAAGMMDPVLEERAMEQTLTGVLESVIHLDDHVQAGFNLIVHEFENQGCLLSTCINACCLALLNAGCSLRSLFAAVTLCVSGDKVLVDPSAEQVAELRGKCGEAGVSFVTLTCTNRSVGSPEVLHVHVAGRVSPDTLRSCYAFLCSDSVLPELFGFFGGVVSADLFGEGKSDEHSGGKMEVSDDDDEN